MAIYVFLYQSFTSRAAQQINSKDRQVETKFHIFRKKRCSAKKLYSGFSFSVYNKCDFVMLKLVFKVDWLSRSVMMMMMMMMALGDAAFTFCDTCIAYC